MKRLLFFIVMTGFLSGCATHQDEEALNKEVVILNQEIDQLSAELARLKAQQVASAQDLKQTKTQ